MSIDFRFGGDTFRESAQPDSLRNTLTEEVSSQDRYERPSPILGEILLAWRTLEHEHIDVSPRVYMIAGAIVFLAIVYAVFTDSPLMAIVFILIGAIGYLSTERDPKEVEYMITSKGIVAGRELFSYRDIGSFWIFEDSDFPPFISFSLPEKFAQHIHIPIGDVDPDDLREALSEFVPEVEHELDLVDMIGKMFHI